MKNMINHKTAYFCFTVRRTFVNYFKSSKPPENKTLHSSINQFSFGDNSEVSKFSSRKPVIDPKINGQHYDLAIIGGGSAGIALAYVFNI